MAIELTRRATPDEIITGLGRYTGFWRQVFLEAQAQKASDIHVHALAEGLLVRLRVDGTLQKVETPVEADAIDELLITLKQIAGLDTGTRRTGQDGSFSLALTQSTYRISLSPGYGYGECMVLRVIREDEMPKLENLRLSEKALADIKWASSQSQGFFLVTGPTGSGKSTTLQAALMHLPRYPMSVLTAEDPVERVLPGVIHQKITPDFGWKEAIKTALRFDPDVIFVGEMRDEVSTALAVEAAQTGHIVMSTLHTNSVVETIDRLFFLGVKDFEIADSLLYISAQRLLNKLCRHCRNPHGDYYVREHSGCEACNQGYKGRVLLLEYLACPDPKHILGGDKAALEASLSQTLMGELEKAVERGDVCARILESARRKGKF